MVVSDPLPPMKRATETTSWELLFTCLLLNILGCNQNGVCFDNYTHGLCHSRDEGPRTSYYLLDLLRDLLSFLIVFISLTL